MSPVQNVTHVPVHSSPQKAGFLKKLFGKHDHALLALLLGCGLRRQELASLKVGDIVEREGRAVIVDLLGKGRRVRTVAIPFLGQTKHRSLDGGCGH